MDVPLKISLLNLDNPVFCNFLFWTAILALKMYFMSILTAFHRFRQKIFANPEDAAIMRVEVAFNNQDVERVRRAHRNDIENILPYFTIGMLYIAIDPNQTIAMILFRIATIARIFHTLVYAVYPIRQPTRLICFAVQSSIAAYMAIHIILLGSEIFWPLEIVLICGKLFATMIIYRKKLSKP